MILPDGWFGRPHDNIHILTRVEMRGARLLIELDDQLHLSISLPVAIEDEGNEIKVRDFRQCVFDWREYGDTTDHCSIYDNGEILFVAPPGA